MAESSHPVPANRTVATSAVAGTVLTAVASVLGVVPDSWKGPVVAVALVCSTVLAVVWLLGWQKHEARAPLPLGPATDAGVSAGTVSFRPLSSASSDVAPEEPGDPETLPHIDTHTDPVPADGNDQAHAR